MISAIEFLPRWTETLGWTLLNSLWQGAILTVLVIVVLRMMPTRFSKARYAIACAAMVLLFMGSVGTFLILEQQSKINSAEISYLFTAQNPESHAAEMSDSQFGLTHSLASARTLIDQNMPFILLAWLVGSIAFSLRLIGGWWFISRLKSNSTHLNGQWYDQLNSLARNFGITKVIQLAESAHITTPMVLGFFKPLVLVPTGMLSGLSAAEIETIFLHELAHIRRHDYIINIAQAVVETIFFFSPFVWIISNIVRREREYCCDDEVISVHGSTITYAKALAQLEEWKLTRSIFALALAANKNQLLNRIKRIMEKTGQKYSVKDRFIPAVLLIVGLVCASWLTVQKKNQQTVVADHTLAQDTTPKTSKSSRTTIIRIDENGDTHEQIFEEGSDDETFFAWAPPTPLADFEFPEVPGVPFPAMPAVPAMPAFPSFPAFPSVGAFPTPPAGVWRISPGYRDTIPGAWRHTGDWEHFSKEFEKKFSEEFSDFYKNHEADFDKMMKEMEIKFKEEFESGNFHGQLMEAQRLHELAQLGEIASGEHFRVSEDLMHEAEALASLSELQAPMLAGMAGLSADLAQLDGNLQVMNEQFELFESEFKEMLIKDGYLKKDEKLENISWSDDAIEVNGKKIKDSDAKRYHEKHEKLFGSRFHINKTE